MISGSSIDSAALLLTVRAPIYVSTAGDDNNAGTSWSNAKRSLPAAMGAARSDDTIWMSAGTYRPNDADRLRKYLARFGLCWDDLN